VLGRTVCGVTATAGTADATPLRLNVDVFVAECAARGALSDSARAALVGVSRETVWHWRHGKQSPSLDAITRIAQTFEISVESLLMNRRAA
jgi:transcriptional regulator with XRE-family HTH domain